MDPYIPKPILINSNTMTGNSFLCGFINFPEGSADAVSQGTLIPAEGNDPPCLLYTETKTDKWLPAQLLPPFIFGDTDPTPKEFDVQFEYSGKKSSKIRVTATMGHPDTDKPALYKPRVFVLMDVEGSESKAYGFLVDICEGDIISYMTGPGENFQVIIDTSEHIPDEISTSIFLFPVDITVPAFTLNLIGQNKGSETVTFEGAPVFDPGKNNQLPNSL